MSNAHELQQAIIQAEAKVNELREKLKQQTTAERLQAVSTIKELIELHQLSATDLGFAGKKAAAPKRPARVDKGVKVAPKYVDPASGKTWSGRGRMPDWLKANLSNGHDKQNYLILKS